MQDDLVTDPLPFSIRDLQRKADGSFIVECNGFPFHATQEGTPLAFKQILDMIDAGEPVADFEEQLPPEDPEAVERFWRDGQIEAVRWLRERHLDELTLVVETTLTGEQFSQLLEYLNALRNWPQSAFFPNNARRPAPAPWILDYLT